MRPQTNSMKVGVSPYADSMKDNTEKDNWVMGGGLSTCISKLEW